MTAETADIRFVCQCGQRLVVEATAAGMALECPNCQASLTVPLAPVRREVVPEREAAKGKRRKTSAPARTGAPLSDSDFRTAELEGELAAATAEIARLQHELKEAVEERERFNASVTHTHAELKAFQGERQQSKTDLANVRQRLATVEVQLANREQELAEAREALAELEARAVGVDAALGEEQQQNAIAISELEQSRDAIALYQAQIAAAETSIDGLAAAADEASRELSEAREQLLAAAEVGQRLEVAEDELREAHAKFLRVDEENQALAAKMEQARAESESLRCDLKATETGAELLSLRSKLGDTERSRAQAAERLASVEGELKVLRELDGKLRAEFETVQKKNVELRSKLEAAAESQVAKDNQVIRGIIARQNTELAQHFREIHRLRRGRFWLKIVYMLFGLGILGVIAIALKVLPEAVKF